jgi:glycerol transport system substrate-binding protein
MNSCLPGRFGADMHISSHRRAFFVFLSTVIMISANTSDVLCEEKPVRPSPEVFIEKWAEYFTPSAFNKEERTKELRWFREAARPLRGLKIKVTAEDIATHLYERDVLSKAFKEITGITVEQDIIPEGELVSKISEQMLTGRHIYDAYVNDADFNGTHARLGKVVNLTEYMNGDGRDYTDPWLDLGDFLNPEFAKDYDGNLLQLIDQQFPILYWFRYDWFSDPAVKADFKAQFGYELGVPVNWAAYEDIAKFFTGRTMKNPDGSSVKAWGHLDYGKPSASLGWRFTDSWLSIAGVGDKGLPNGLPVDEWGIRIEDRIPVGSMVERGGGLNSPAAVYALEKYIDWMKKYAPPYAGRIEWSEVGPIAGEGEIAQTIYFCGTFISYPNYHKPGSPVCDNSGKPLWRVAPVPHGKYWEEGMKVGYQDSGSWTIPYNVRGRHRAAAWLYAQFCVSKTVSVRKFLVGLTPNRRSTITNEYVRERAPYYGGLIEFYLSSDENEFTDTGLNVPYYPALSALWWKYIAAAVKGDLTPQQAMDKLAAEQDDLMSKLKLNKYSPKLNPLLTKEEWYKKGVKPHKQGEDKPVTIPYDELLNKWRAEKRNNK